MRIGIIGFGDMGKLYAHHFYKKGFDSIYICDLPQNFLQLQKDYPQYQVVQDGFAVSRMCDFIMYSVETGNIDKCVAMYGPSTKVNAIVCGQTSVKEPEIKAFEMYLPSDVHIVTCHSLHGPKVDPKGQPLVIIRHRASQEAYETALRVLETLESKIVHLSYLEHDRITADTQAVTHVAFLSMGTAWKTRSTYPWENNRYLVPIFLYKSFLFTIQGGIDNVKILMALRIYGSKWHVYAGLAIMNPSAKKQIEQYANSVSELFILMIQEEHEKFKSRIQKAAEFVFGSSSSHEPILLSDSILDQFSLSIIPRDQRMPNSHLSLLAMVDCWYSLGIKPYDHLICQTPPFRMLLGITEYLFRDKDSLERALDAALNCKEIRGEDCEFYRATIGWTEMIQFQNMEGYRKRFEETASFFQNRIQEASAKSAQLIQLITQKTSFE